MECSGLPKIWITRGFVRLALVLVASMLAACASGIRSEVTRPALTHPDLRIQLLDLFNRDQRARREMLRAIKGAPKGEDGRTIYPERAMPLVEAARSIDAESTAFVESMIDQYGWPTFDMVGRDGANAAWLLAQHADEHPELQQRALALMKPLADAGQADPAKLAYLTNRVLVAQRTNQIYGTQFTADPDGIQRPFPIEDAEQVDKRRARVGLPPMKTAARQWERSVSIKTSPHPLDSFPDR